MIKNIEVKIQKESPSTILSAYSSAIKISESTKVSDIKFEIKKTVTFKEEVASEIVYVRNKEAKDEDTINPDFRIEYVLTLK